MIAYIDPNLRHLMRFSVQLLLDNATTDCGDGAGVNRRHLMRFSVQSLLLILEVELVLICDTRFGAISQAEVHQPVVRQEVVHREVGHHAKSTTTRLQPLCRQMKSPNDVLAANYACY